MFSSRSKLIADSILILLILSALAGCARVAADSGLEVHREAVKMYGHLSKAGLAEAALWVFFGKGVEIRCSTGSFEVRFDDGTTARDQGVLYVETREVENPIATHGMAGPSSATKLSARGNP